MKKRLLQRFARSAAPGGFAPERPTVVAATHYRAGSQWIHTIMRAVSPEPVVTSTPEELLARGIAPGEVHAPAYVTREQLAALTLPADTRIFVVIRDLRDTLVSLYFAVLASHYPRPRHATSRRELADLAPEDALLRLLRREGFGSRIQRSWIGADVPVFRYEDLVQRDTELLVPLLADYCGFAMPREEIERVIVANRFEKLSGGRAAGTEDGAAHYRKGQAGDWHNYFSPRVTAEFKRLYGDLLIATGYEQDLDWQPDPELAPKNYGEDPEADLARVMRDRAAILKGYATYTDLFVTRDEQVAFLKASVVEAAALLEGIAGKGGARPDKHAASEAAAWLERTKDVRG